MPDDFDPNGTLKLGYVVGTAHLDPHVGSPPALAMSMMPIYDRLTSVNDDFEVEPMLATSWEFAEDGKSMEMSLREGISFHDGTPFNAQAVKVNIDRAKATTSNTGGYLLSVASVDVVDDDTVKFNLQNGGAQLPAMLASPAGMMVSPKAIAERSGELALNPGDSGTGPYKVVQFEPNQRVVYEPAQPAGEHWDTGAGLVKRIEFIYIATGAQRINAVRASDIDLGHITGTDVAQAQQLVSSGQAEGREITLAVTTQALHIKASRPNMSNVKFRQAIHYATDKESMAEGLFSGNCAVTSQYLPEGHWAWSPKAAEIYDFDLDKAKQLIRESGVTNPSFEIVHYSIYELPAQAMQAMMKDAGINVSLLPQQPAEVTVGMREGRYDSHQNVLAAPVADPSYIIDFAYLGNTVLVPEAEQAKFRALLIEANDPTKSQDERAEVWNDLWYELEMGAYAIPICHSKQVWMHRGDVGGLEDRYPYTWSGQTDFRYLYRTS